MPSLLMPTARSRSICSPQPAMAADEDEAELRRLLQRPTTRAAEPVLLPPQEPEVVAALGVEASAPRLQSLMLSPSPRRSAPSGKPNRR